MGHVFNSGALEEAAGKSEVQDPQLRRHLSFLRVKYTATTTTTTTANSADQYVGQSRGPGALVEESLGQCFL